jgi:hypothetical protein
MLNGRWRLSSKNTVEQCENVDGEENYAFKSLSISSSTGATS